MALIHFLSRLLSSIKYSRNNRGKSRKRGIVNRYRYRLAKHEVLENRALLASLIIGETINETIGTIGDEDHFELSLAAPAKVYVDGLTAFGDVQWSLKNEYSTFATNIALSAQSPVLELAAGNYDLSFEANGLFDASTGPYSFRVLDVGPGATPINPAPSVTITRGPVNGSQTDIYTLAANAGDEFTFEPLPYGGSSNPTWRLLNPLGQDVFNISLGATQSNIVTPITGTYTLIIDGSLSEFTDENFSYGFTTTFLGNTPPTPFSGTPITFGVPESASFTGVSGEQADYTFNIASTTNVFFDGLLSEVGANIRLQGPGFDQVFGFDDFAALKLYPGTYQLSVFDVVGGTFGSYSFNLLDLSTADALTPNIDVNGSLSPPSEAKTFKFDATAGEKFYLQFPAFSGSFATSVSLYSPSGNLVFSRPEFFGDLDTFTVAETGTYSLIFQGSISDPTPVDYSFNLRPVVTAAPVALTFVTTTNGSISSIGAQDQYSFSLNATKDLYFDFLSSGFSGTITLKGAGVDFTSPSISDFVQLNLLPGDYVLTVDASGIETGAYSFKVLDLSDATPLVLNTNTTQSITVSETRAFKFNATAGDKFYFDVVSASGFFNTLFELYSPSGVTVFSQYEIFGDIDTFTAPETGVYTILYRGSSITDSTPVESIFKIQSVVEEAPAAITLGTVVSGSISAPGERDRYTLSIETAGRYFFNLQASQIGTSPWSLKGPGIDVALNNTNPWFDLVPGSYELTFDPSGDTIGNYSFLVFGQASILALPLNSNISGTFSPAGQTIAYSFNATAGDKFFFQSQNFDSFSTFWRLLSPTGTVVFDQQLYLGGNTEPPAFSLTGTYTLLLQGYIDETAPANYAFRVQPVATSTTTALTIGATVNGSISTLGEQDVYSFEVSAATRNLYFDHLPSAASVNWRLKGPGIDEVISGNTYKSNLQLGNYQLTVDGNGDSTGLYSLRILNLADATALTTGVNTLGSINPDATAAYKFNVTAGNQFFFDNKTTIPNNTFWRLVSPTGTEIFNASLSSGDIDTLTLTQTGTYILLIEGSNGETNVTNFAFKVQPVVSTASTAITLGAVTSGFISAPGEQDVFTLTLEAAATLHFDTLSSSVAGTARIKGPGIDQVFPLSLSSIPAQLLIAGDYELTVEGNGDSVGAYSFRVKDLSTATPLNFATQIITTLSPAAETDLYKFSANAGDRFTFDTSTANPQNAQWRLINPYGQIVFSSSLVSDQLNVNLPVAGLYTLLIEGSSSDTGTTSYSFRVNFLGNTPPTPFTGIPLDFDVATSGEIGVLGEEDKYTFTLASNKLLAFDALSSEPGMTWALQGVTGIIVSSTDFNVDSYFQNFPTLNLTPGDYQLTIGNQGSTGTYTFQMIDFDSATALTLGAPEAGSLFAAETAKAFQFNATEGDLIFLNSSTVAPQNAGWRLISPKGQTIFNETLGADGEVQLTDTGTYTLVLIGYYFDAGQIDYDFNVYLIPQSAPITLTLGTTVLGNLSVPGEQVRYTFSVASDTRVYFDALTSANNISWMLEGPTGTVVPQEGIENSDYYLNYFVSAPNLVPGDYTLTIDGFGAATGSFEFNLANFADAELLTPGTPVSDVLSPGNVTKAYRFSANAGDKFYFDSQTALPGNASWTLIDPIGRNVFSVNLSDVDPVPFELSGTYTLFVVGYYYDVDPVPFYIDVVPVSQSAPSPITLGPTLRSGSIELGEQDEYTFSFTSPTLVHFDAISSDPNLSWSLTGPEGIVPGFFNVSVTNDASVKLPAGSYILTIDGNGAATGDYSFRMLNLSDATPLNFGELFNNSLNPASETDAYKFTANAGDGIFFDAQTSLPGNASWTLLDPRGVELYTTSLGSNWEWDALPLSGTYTLLIKGYFYDIDPVAYGFEVNQKQYITGPLTLGTTLTGNVSNPGDRYQYTFTLANDTRVQFDGFENTGNFLWFLLGPSGPIVTGRPIEQDSHGWFGSNNATMNLTAGTYTLTLDAPGDETGSFSFRLLDISNAPDLLLGTVIVNALNPANETDAYKFSANAGDRLYFDAQTALPQSADWLLVDPRGQTIATSSLGTDFETVPLPVTGNYTLLIEGAFTDIVDTNYSFSVNKIDQNPADTLLVPSSIPENQPNVSTVGQFVTSDVDSSSIQTFTLVSGAGSADNSAFNIVGNELRTVSSFNFEAKSTYSIRVRTVDTLGLLFERTYTVNVTNVNETPTNIALSNGSLPENAGVNAVVGALSGTDPDVGDVLTYSLPVGLNNNDLFNITGNSLRANASFDFESLASYTVTVRVTDAGGLTFDKQFPITVTNVNEAPTNIALSANTVAELSALNTVIGLLTSTDQDAGDTATYSLPLGLDNNGLFNISGNALRTNATYNFELQPSYTITVRVTDALGLTFNKQFTINVLNVNENPTNITLSNSSIPENAGTNAVIGTLTATDPDAGSVFTFSLPTGVSNNSLFNISGTSLRANDSFNFEALTSYSVTIRVADAGGLTFDKLFTISVTNVNENPTDIALSNNTLVENAGTNAVVGTLSATDPDAGSVFTFSLPNNVTNNNLFNISGTTLRANSSLDFETQPTLSVTVRVTDATGLTFDKLFTINTTNVNEAPTNILLSNSTIAENSGPDAVIGTLTATDPDAGSVLTFSLPTSITNNNLFNLSGTSLRANASLNFETQPTLLVTVRVTDASGLSFDKTFTINTTNVNESPTDITLSNSVIPENAGANAVVGTLVGVDPDAGSTLTYSLPVGLGSNSLFNISGTSLRATASLNFETQASHAITVRVSDGSLTFDKQFTINVTNVNEAPTDITLSNSSIAENAGANAVIGTLSGVDPDASTSLAFTLPTGLTSNSLFNVSGNSLRANASLDFETQSTYIVTVRASDGALSFDKQITIGVSNVNDPPSIASPTSQAININTPLVFSATNANAISVADADAGIATVELILTTANGLATLSSTAGVTFTAGANGQATYTVRGTLASLNAALNGLSFQPSLNFSGAASIAITISDLGNTGPGGALTASRTIAVTVANPAFIVDNSDLGYSETGSWVSSSITGINGSNTRFSSSANAVATWNAPNLAPGYYSVAFWRVAVASNSSTARVSVVHNGITEPAQTVNLSTGAAGFVELGTFFFSGGPGEFVRLSQGTPVGALRADSVRFTKLPPTANAAPTITAPSTQAAAGNTPVVFSTTNANAISVADVDAGIATVELTLTTTNGLATLPSTAGLTFTAGANGQATYTVRGSLASLNAALNGLSFQPSLNFSGAASIAITVSDLGNTGLGGALTASKTIAVTVANPAFIVDNSDLGYSETGSWVSSSITGINGSNTRFSGSANAVATWNAPNLAPGYYSVAIWRVAVASNSTNASVTVVHNGITEPAQTVNLATGAAGFVELGTFFFSGGPGEFVRLSQGSPAGNLRTDSVRFNRLPIANAAPTITAPTTQSAAGNTPVVFSTTNANAISVADADAGNSTVQLTVTAANGSTTLPSTAGLTFTAGANGQATFTVRGTLASLNAALNGLSFQPSLNFSGAASISLSVSDLGNTGLGGALSANRTIAVTVANPAFVVDNSDLGYSETGTWISSSVPGVNGSNTRFSPNSNAVATWNAPNLAPGYYSVAIWRVAVSNNSTNASVTVVHNGITEPAQTVNLATGAAGFVELGTFFFSGAPGELVRLSQGPTIGNLRTDSVRFNRLPIANVAPTITAPTTQAIAGNTPVVFSTTNANVISVADVDAGIANIELTLTTTNGLATLPSTAGLTFTAGANGQATYTVRGSLASLNTALNGLSFQPSLNFSGAASISLTVSDLGNTGLGGALTANRTIAVTVANPAFIVDNSDLGYSETGSWVSSSITGINGSNTRFSGSANAVATWNAPNLTPGYYSVAIWRVAVASNSPNASVTVVHNGITEPAQTVNLATGAAGFVELGTFFFSGVPGELVRLSQGSPVGNLRTDSVRFNRLPIANAAPTITAPTTQSAAGNTPVVFSTANANAISVADADAGNSTVQLTVTAANGSTTLPSTAGLTFTAGANGQATYTVRGTLASLNAALNGLSFQPSLNFSGAASISLSFSDLGNTGLGGALTASRTIAVTVANPAFIVDNSDLGYSETGSWVSSSITGINGSNTRFSSSANAVATWNAPNLAPGYYSVAFWRVAVASNSSTARVSVVHNGITEPAQTVNLSTGAAGFVELGTFFFSGAPGEFVRLSQGTPVGALRADSVRFTKLPPTANAAPTITAPSTQAAAGNTPVVFSTTNANAISVADVDAGIATVELTLTTTNGLATLPSTAGLTFTAGANGQATYTVRGSLASLNAALNGLSFQPSLNFSGAASIAITVSDLGNTGLGGALTANRTIAVTVANPAFIVDNSDLGYSETGSWVSSSITGINGSNTRFSGSANAVATWNAPNLAPGYYSVAIWRVAVASNSPNASVTVVHNGITEPAQTVNLATGAAGFVELGTFFFSGVPGELVRLSQGSPAGNLRTDSVRFIKQPPTV